MVQNKSNLELQLELKKLRAENLQLKNQIKKITQTSNPETFLKSVINTIPDLIWIKDPDGVYITCNSKFEQLYGSKSEDIVGKTDYDFVNKKLADFFKKNDKIAIEASKPSVNEEEITYADDGHIELVETIKTPIYDHNRKVYGVLGIARDITHRKKAEEALSQSEKKFRILSEASTHSILILQNNKVVYFNPAFVSISEYPAAKIKATPFLNTVCSEHRKLVGTHILKVKNGEKHSDHIEHRLLTPEGKTKWLHTSFTVIDYENSPAILTTSYDITIEKNALNEVLKEKAYTEHTINAIPGLFAQLSKDGKIIRCNKNLETVSGYTFDEIKELTIFDFIDTDQKKKMKLSIEKVFDTGQGELEIQLRAKNGNNIPFLINGKKILLDNKSYILGMGQDITELKKTEYLLEASQKIASMGSYTVDMVSGNWESSLIFDNIIGIDETFVRDQEGWLSLIHPGDREEVIRYSYEAVRNMESFNAEYRINKQDDQTVRWMHSMGKTEYNEEGRPVSMIGTLQDITERKKSEKTLRETLAREQQLANIYRMSPVGIIFGGIDGKIINCNTAYAELLGYTVDELIKLNWNKKLTPTKWHDIEQRELAKLCPENNKIIYEKEYIRKDGSSVPIELVVSAINNKNGKPDLYLAFVSDITKRKEIENALIKNAEIQKRLSERIHAGIQAGNMAW